MKLCEIHVAIESCCENHLSLPNSWMGYCHSIRNAKVFPALNCSICKMPSNRWVEGMDIHHVGSLFVPSGGMSVYCALPQHIFRHNFSGKFVFLPFDFQLFLKISSWLSSLGIWFYSPFYVHPFWRGCQVVRWRTGGRAVLRFQPVEWMRSLEDLGKHRKTIPTGKHQKSSRNVKRHKSFESK